MHINFAFKINYLENRHREIKLENTFKVLETLSLAHC